MTNLHTISILLLAISSNLDNVGVGLSYGTRKISIPFLSNLFIALITGTGTWLSMMVGAQITNVISPQAANAVGALMIGGTGVWIFVQELSRRNEEPENIEQYYQESNFENQSFFKRMLMVLEHPFLADTDFSGHISMKEGFLLGLALTLNNLTNGIGAGLLGISPTLTTAFVVIFSIITIWFGLGFGQYATTRWFGKLAGPISGLMLVFLGVYEYFG